MGITGNKLSALSAAYAEAEANQGFGSLGTWPNEPNEGEHELTLTKMEAKEDGKFAFKPNKNPGTKTVERDALEVQFHYANTNEDGTENHFKGSPIVIPYDQKGLPENQMTRVRIATDRLKGSLKGLLGDSISNDLGTDINGALDILKSAHDNGTFVRVKAFLSFRERNDKKGYNKEEYIRELLAS